jgi:hypothetical protein
MTALASNVDLDDLVSEEEFARSLGVSIRTPRRWHDERIGPARIRVGRQTFYRKSAIAEWPETQEQEHTPMSGTWFITKAEGRDAADAFNAAREEAWYWNGHHGSSGTICEKQRFIMVDVPPATLGEVEFGDWAEDEVTQLLFARQDDALDDFWGPAGCVDHGDGSFTFFGWARS